jgi:SAM-dependent methyltransferase
MLVSLSKKFVFIANLKTASTSIEHALRPYCEICLQRYEWGKHMSYSEFELKFPWIFDIVPRHQLFFFGVIRDPIEYVTSLYLSHKDPKFQNDPTRSTQNMSFDRFLIDWTRLHIEQFELQSKRFLNSKGDLGVDYVVDYRDLNARWPQIAELLGVPTGVLPRLNVSPESKFSISDKARASLEDRFSDDYFFIRRYVGGRSSTARSRVSASAEGSAGSLALDNEGMSVQVSNDFGLEGVSMEYFREDQTPSSLELVVTLYRCLLGREPENESVVKEKVASFPKVSELLAHFVGSEEFRIKHKAPASVFTSYLDVVRAGMNTVNGSVQTTISKKKQKEVFARVKQQWTSLGESDPYWSVLTSEKFRLSRIESHIEQFKVSGNQSFSTLMVGLENAGLISEIPNNLVCLELGSGVGRVTRFLSRAFSKVFAVDISPGNMKLCQEYMRSENCDNVEYLIVDDLIDFAKLPNFDFFYSVIVLQHNPPPVIVYLLQSIFQKANKGAIIYFQVPVSLPNYKFEVDEYLKEDIAVLDMHCVPMRIVLQTMTSFGIDLVFCQPDSWTGMPGSTTFIGVRR